MASLPDLPRAPARSAPHRDIRAVALVHEERADRERLASYRVGGSWSRTRELALPSGLQLGVHACRFEPGFTFPVVQPAAELELVVSMGGVMDVRTPDGRVVQRGGERLELGRQRQPTPLVVRPATDAELTSVTLTLRAARIRELLGAAALPAELAAVVDSPEPAPLRAHAAPPRLLRLVEEILHADVRGPARVLWHEAKALELLAMITDDLAEAARDAAPLCSPIERERLERARRSLVAHLDAPPTLAELARAAGFNVTKLKAAFRAEFGAPIFTYLRRARMAHARRLLADAGFTWTELHRWTAGRPKSLATLTRVTATTTP